MKKVLIVELWAIGDAVIATSAIQRALEAGYKVSMLCKASNVEFLSRHYPEVDFISYEAPWTQFKGKYNLWKWDWSALKTLFKKIKKVKFDLVISARPDPREQLLINRFGARMVLSPAHPRFTFLVNKKSKGVVLHDHRVELWNALLDVELKGEVLAPKLQLQDSGELGCDLFIHCGASQPLRRVDVKVWGEVVKLVRARWPSVKIGVMPDLDGFGESLADLVDVVYRAGSVQQMLEQMSKAQLFLGNDSGPAHIAAALSIPSATFFGPQLVERFKPYHSLNESVEGGACEYKPCKDNCRYTYAKCMSVHDAESIVNRIVSVAGKANMSIFE